jgi:hypothetical protein
MIVKELGGYWLRTTLGEGSSYDTDDSKEKIPYVKAILMVARMKTHCRT